MKNSVRGFTLIELLVVIAILASIAFRSSAACRKKPWKIFQSPFDSRSSLENDSTSPVSCGLNPNAVAQSTHKIQKPTLFILLALAQNNNTQVKFASVTNATVTALRDASTPGGTAPGGTQKKRTAINALFADQHVESLSWTTFKAPKSGPPDDLSQYRWDL
ncbi:MAG: prepilin-type N-terminal cleavage/methylation domain-containing protein [Chthoniobacterales bacterium]